LIIGSVIPDAGYLFGEKGADEFSHGFLGSFGFCLPAGILMVALFYWLRAPLVRILPAPYQRALFPLCQRPPGSLWAIIISLLIGTWTHLLWDSFTHTTGWFTQHLPVLQSQVAVVAGRQARVCHLLWYGCSFAGVVWLFVLFERWKQVCVGAGAGVRSTTMMRDAVLVAILAVPVELVHHLVRLNKIGLCLLAVAFALLVLGIVLIVANARKDPTVTAPITEGRDAGALGEDVRKRG
jgi:hypothetical protein